MKRCILFTIIISLCFFPSCGIWGSDNVEMKLTDEGGIDSIVYDGKIYDIWSTAQDYYTFYKLPQEELVKRFRIFGAIYKVESEDLGTLFRVGMSTWLDTSAFSKITYLLSEETQLPNIKSVAIDKIGLRSYQGTSIDMFESLNGFYELDNKLDYTFSKEIWNKGNSSIYLDEILDFNTSINAEYFDDNLSLDSNSLVNRAYIVFVLSDYDSFYAGPYRLIEYNNQLYIQLAVDSPATLLNAPFYLIKSEYYDIFKDALENH